MGGRGLGPLGRGSGFDGDDGLFGVPGYLPADLYELPAVDDILQVEEDNLGVRVVLEIAQEVHLAYIGLVAEGDELGEPDVPPGRLVQGRGAKGPGLGDKGYVAVLGMNPGKGGV